MTVKVWMDNFGPQNVNVRCKSLDGQLWPQNADDDYYDYGDDDDDCDCFEMLSAVPPCSLLPLIAAPISAGSTTVLVVLLHTSSILAY